MFKPYSLESATGPIGSFRWLERTGLDLDSGPTSLFLEPSPDQIAPLDFLNGTSSLVQMLTINPQALHPLADALRVIDGSLAELMAQAAVSAIADNGHFYTTVSHGCACCGHDHGGMQKYEVINLTNELEAGIASGLYSHDFDGLLAAVAEITGISATDVGAKFNDMVTTLAQTLTETTPANEPAGDDLPADTSTTGTVEVGGSVSGFRDGRDDEDWYAVELEEGVTYTIIMLRSGDNPHTDPFLNLYDGSGTLVDSNDDIEIDGESPAENRNSWIEFTPSSSGTFYIGATGYDDSQFVSSGNYTIYVEEGDNRPDFTIEEAAFFLTDQFDNKAVWDKTDLTFYIDDIAEGAQALALQALALWEEVSGLTFTRVSDAAGADIKFNENNGEDDAQQAFASSSTNGNGVIRQVTITVSENWSVFGANDPRGTEGEPNYLLNSYRYQTYIHEIGHALGLGHGGPYNGVSSNSAGTRFNVYNQDAWNYSVMSYFDQGEAGTGTPRLVLGLNMVDIVAIQSLYGPNTSTRTGDSVYGFNSTESGVYDFETTFADEGIRPPSLAIYDANGVDTLDMSGWGTNQEISLIAGTFSSVGDNFNTGASDDPLINNVSIAIGTVIENAVGGSGNDVITGNAADNELTGNGGNDQLIGGEGTDTAIYSGNRSAYTIEDNGDGTFTVTGEGVDTLSGIEFAKFADQTVSLEQTTTPTFTNGNDSAVGTSGDDVLDALAGDDVVEGGNGNDIIDGNNGADRLSGNAGNDVLRGDIAFALDGIEGQVYRAYQAVFDRDPDVGGYNAFLTEIQLGNLTQLDVISEFIASAEFQDTYGSLSNAEFVDLLYANVLPGNNDQAGRSAFTTALNDGSLSRADVVAEFANSNEFIVSTRVESDAFASTIALDPVDFQIFRLYQSVFQRDPDAGGFAAFTGSLRVGTVTAESAANDFVSSAEFQDTYGALNNTQFVDLLFQNVLPGNNDQAGRSAFVTALNDGSLSRADVVLELTNSFEFREATEVAAQTFIQSYNAGLSSDTLIGGTGNDILFGSDGADIFVFEGNDSGEDTILDFVSGVDTINFDTVSGINNFADVQAATSQQGADTLITLSSGNTILLRNVTASELEASDFSFGNVTSAEPSSAGQSSKVASQTVVSEIPLSDFEDLQDLALSAQPEVGHAALMSAPIPPVLGELGEAALFAEDVDADLWA